MIKLSIITINLNNLPGLVRTFESVISQTYPCIEYIIIDGASSDGSKEFIEAKSDKLAKFISEPDRGIYNAMNKGLQYATGEFILCLNSGDYLYSNDTISNAVKSVNENSDLVAFDLLYKTGNLYELKKNPKSVSVSYFTKHVLYHPGVFVSRKVHERYGYYDESMRIAADWAFFLKIAGLNKCNYQYVSIKLSVFCTDGVSSNLINIDLQTQERERFLSGLVPKAILEELFLLQSISELKKYDVRKMIERETMKLNKFNQFKSEFRAGSRFKALRNLLLVNAGFQYKGIALKMYLRSLFLKYYV